MGDAARAEAQMSTGDFSANEDEEPAVVLGELDDEGLLAALREVIGPDEPPPAWSAELAKASFGLREADTELASLVSDSERGADRGSEPVLRSRGTSRLAVFDAGDLSVEIEIEPGARADSWRLTGQLIPAAPARILLRRAPGQVAQEVDADSRGRFAIEHLAGGPLSLLCRRDTGPAAVTEWIAIG